MTRLVDWFWDSLQAHPLRVVYLGFLLVIAMVAIALGWYFIDPESPYNEKPTPMGERSIFSDHVHH